MEEEAIRQRKVYYIKDVNIPLAIEKEASGYMREVKQGKLELILIKIFNYIVEKL